MATSLVLCHDHAVEAKDYLSSRLKKGTSSEQRMINPDDE